MFKEIGKLKGLLNYPQQLILGLDNIAHVNGDDLTLIITSEECAELIQAISKIKRYGFRGVYERNLHEEVADILICIVELVSLGYLDIDKVAKYQELKIDRELERTIQKVEEKRKETEKHGTCE